MQQKGADYVARLLALTNHDEEVIFFTSSCGCLFSVCCFFILKLVVFLVHVDCDACVFNKQSNSLNYRRDTLL